MTAYVNTTRDVGSELQKNEAKAQSLQVRVLEWFKSNYRGAYRPSEVHKALSKEGRVLITSIRRAMSNLTKAEHLVKTDLQKMGPNGSPEYLWKLCDDHRAFIRTQKRGKRKERKPISQLEIF